jgi:hypothetical protein
LFAVLLIRDSTQGKLTRVDIIIKRLEDDWFMGLETRNDEVKTTYTNKRESIKESMDCTGHDPKIAELLINSLQHAAENVVSNCMQSHTSYSIHHHAWH